MSNPLPRQRNSDRDPEVSAFRAHRRTLVDRRGWWVRHECGGCDSKITENQLECSGCGRQLVGRKYAAVLP